jgi:hypothetical protein
MKASDRSKFKEFHKKPSEKKSVDVYDYYLYEDYASWT